MADAPSGGGGWSAVEVIVALVLGIGLITTLTGGTIKPIFDTPDTAKKASTAGVKGTTTAGCTIIVSRPKTKEKIDTAVTVVGGFPECMAASSIPETINAQVVDSKGTSLSSYIAIPVDKGFFGLGSSTFSATIPLSGAAQSTSGYLILTGPTRADGSVLNARVAIQFIPGSSISAPAGATGGSYFVPNTSAQTTTTTTTTNTPPPSYNPPATITPPPSSGSGGSGTTF